MTDYAKIDLLFQYILTLAGEEEWDDRELGPIHLIKYLYLSDLAYAERNNGETFTGLPWRFYHFGPWAEEAHGRIEPALMAIGSEKRTFSTLKYDEVRRYSPKKSSHLLHQLEQQVPLSIDGPLRKAVHKFGSDTESLLDHTYRTLPMLTAAPNELLDFSRAALKQVVREEEEKPKTLTTRQMKKRKQAIEDLKNRLKNSSPPKDDALVTPEEEPRYDDVFFEGVEWLDLLAGEPVTPLEGTAHFSPDVWKSKARYDSEIS
ncbi:hypothetical protein [Desulfatibacillum aliphaticivorans]|uniref:hypothetical protein n=1 Tax=Desulfatibacillum aliphaticivorans TaxID=218208 RepID=UPI0003FD9049|nr:hypothetical protein [Desulfatibacillum aliphaticivorans]